MLHSSTVTSTSTSGVGTNVASTGGGSGWSTHFVNTLFSCANNTCVGVYNASMERTGGSGGYSDDAHVALIDGGYDGNQVFSAYTNSCANTGTVKNASAVTCGSSSFPTSSGRVWTQAAGGSFDQGNNGSTEWSVNGEDDIQWTTP